MTTETFDEIAGRALAKLGPPPGNWVPDRPGTDANVVIVGAGQSGLTLAFALRRSGIGRVILLEAEAEGSESIWRSRARMLTLRTPKVSLGPELGIPDLGFQAWFEHRYDATAFAALGRPATVDWAAYLDWYRRFTAPDIRWSTRLLSVHPDGEHLRLALSGSDGAPQTLTTRKLVLATGLSGNGGPAIPSILTDNLPRALYSHSIEVIDFAALAGRRVAVIGAGASAFDQAATALEQGAAEVHLFCRGDTLPNGGKFRSAAYPAGEHFPLLDDATRWRLVRSYLRRGSTPPPDSVRRATRHANFHLHLGAPLDAVATERNRVRISAAGETFLFDHVIAATGFRTDPTLAPELKDIADAIALWADRYTPPPQEADERLGRFPYLGPAYEFTGKDQGTAPWLRNIHALNYAAFASFARVLGDIASLRTAIPRLAGAIEADLAQADFARHIGNFDIERESEVADELYAARVWRPAVAEPQNRKLAAV